MLAGMADDDDRAFKALADPTRRFLLDLLFERDGRTLTELESELEMTRFGVMKHLKVLEEAGLVVTRRSGREKLHFLNAVPIRLIHDRWIDKYTEPRVSALADLKSALEGMTMSSTTIDPATTQVYRVYIKAPAERVWEAITSAEWSHRYGYGGYVSFDLRPGGAFSAKADERGKAAGMPEDLLVGEVVEVDPPNRLVQTWHPVWSPDIDAEPPTRPAVPHDRDDRGGAGDLGTDRRAALSGRQRGGRAGPRHPADRAGGRPGHRDGLRDLRTCRAWRRRHPARRRPSGRRSTTWACRSP